MLRYALAAAIFVSATPALATITVDQSNINVFTNAPGNTVGSSALSSRPGQPTTQRWQAQTIVAGLTGKLTAIDLQAFFQSDNGNLLVTLGNGEITIGGYATIGTIVVPRSAVISEAQIKAGGFTTVDLSSLNFLVSAGQAFTITLAESAPLPGANFGNFGGWVFGELDSDGNFVSTANYAPGVARISTDSGQSWGVAGADRGFRTYVDVAATPVPESATWILLIFGFGTIGGVLRTRLPNKRLMWARSPRL